MTSDLLGKQANKTDVTSKRHAKGLVIRMTAEACKQNRRSFKKHAKGLVLKQTDEASKQNGHDFEKARKGACPKIDCGSEQTKRT